MGLAETLYKHKLSILEQAKSLCLCTNCQISSSSPFGNSGCTACLLDHTCPMRNNNMDKNGAVLLLNLLIEDIKGMNNNVVCFIPTLRRGQSNNNKTKPRVSDM